MVRKRAVHEASLEAGEILAGARSEAAAIVAGAEREREAIADESRTRGYNEGLGRWNETLTEAWRARDSYLAGNEAQLVRLAVTVARKIVGDLSQADPEAILHTAREAIRAVRGERKIRLRVRPVDEEMVRRRMAELEAAGPESCAITVAADESIILGGCIVETGLGTIDARLEAQLESLEHILLRGFEADGN